MPHFLQNVLNALDRWSDRPLIKVISGTVNGNPTWRTVTYGQFLRDIEKVAGYWIDKLEAVGAKPKDVVGIWVTGDKYNDLASMYGISRAGYTPQMLSKGMSLGGNSVVVQAVLAATGGKAIIFDPYYKEFVKDVPLPTFEMPEVESIAPLSRTLADVPDADELEVGVIFHTSGTTSGRPKPVPETHRWLISQAIGGWPQLYQGKVPATMNNIGAFSNVGSATAISYISCNGQCLVQTSRPDFDEAEFKAMVAEGLNFVLLYAPWLSKLVSIARADPEVHAALKNMTQITYTGASLNPEDEQWLIKNGIPLTVMYATTETAACFTSLVSEAEYLPSMRPFRGVGCTLLPIGHHNAQELDGENENRLGGGKLFNLFVPADAPNCPHPSIRNRPDGHITGDLFEETAPGFYAFRGRNDDWIRTGKHFSFCDTKSIEDNILREAADLVRNCVVVGHYKPGIVLLVEPAIPNPADEGKLKSEIFQRHEAYNNRLYFHEKLHSTEQIVLVDQDTLPRTMEKGNIRRKATEDDHAKLLEEIYTRLRTW